ncbi:hypothetical protein EYF80_010062 [Liparis tanakae]|uniref:Uncharacterized protein n=1 Tax=Liparis tanakae TaxID=230148 RepID=A0A4Z2IPT7_9TELE|nr:hypothetical protein EYF80_010062 [Liparis tanakae]
MSVACAKCILEHEGTASTAPRAGIALLASMRSVSRILMEASAEPVAISWPSRLYEATRHGPLWDVT